MHAERCPVCKDKRDPDCFGCGGKGWVEVSDAAVQVVPTYVPSYPWYPSYPWWGIYPPNTSAPWPQPYYYTTCGTLTDTTTGTTTGGAHTISGMTI